MQTVALTQDQLSKRLSVAARLLKNDNATLSREDKAAFGIDPWHTQGNAPEAIRAQVAAWLECLADERSVIRVAVLPAGWRFHPLSGEQQVGAEHDKPAPQHIENDARRADVPGVSGDQPGRPISNVVHHPCLQRVVCPFAQPDEKDTQGNHRRGHGRELLEQPGASSGEGHKANNHQGLIPVVKRKFREWVLHLPAPIKRKT